MCPDDNNAARLTQIREWADSDAEQVGRLLDDPPDPLWTNQFHSLHGPRCEGSAWRRTVVAVDDQLGVVGCASVVASMLHPGRFPCAIDVHPDFRRRGIGTALLHAVRVLLPHPGLLSTKVRLANIAAAAFLDRVGARRYQHCPGAVLDPRDPDVVRWAAEHQRASCTDLADQDHAALAMIFARQYDWIHQSWSPVGDFDLLTEIAAEEIGAMDPAVSACAWHDGRIGAVAFAFPSESGFEVVAETVAEHQLAGPELLAAALAMVVRRAGSRSGVVLEFDGHRTDPHLYPILTRLPWLRSNPLDLVEIP